jgi:hypothetical protein
LRRRKAVEKAENLDLTGCGRLRDQGFVTERRRLAPIAQSKMSSKAEFIQNGSIMRSERRRGPDVWEFRWQEPDAGRRRHRNRFRSIRFSPEQSVPTADRVNPRKAKAPKSMEMSRPR